MGPSFTARFASRAAAGACFIIAVASQALGAETQLSASPNTTPASEINLTQAGSQTAGADRLHLLVEEALRKSPLITAARNHWQALTRVPVQESTPPEPQIMFQNMAVGNAIPGNDLQTNNFAYFGYGISQDIPFPTKLHLKAAIADKQAASNREAYEAQVRSVVEQVEETYFNLFYLGNSLSLLEQTYDEFQRLAHITVAQYQVGMARQQDVLKAQLEMTSILKEQAMTREAFEQGQSDLKAVLGREQDSPEIQIGEVKPSAFTLNDEQLRKLAITGSPVLKQAEALEASSKDSLKLAREGYIPDFSIAYMYQKTGARFPDYYLATLGIKIPLYFWRKQTPAIEQAVLEKYASHAQAYAAKLSVTSVVQNQWIAIQTTGQLIKLYRDGLIPQAEATLKSALATYRVGKVDFQTLLSAEIDLLRLRQQYDRTVADHEVAAAKIHQIIGDPK
jgi:cobalt-zinc-cadmium efflux system outer membrane protein